MMSLSTPNSTFPLLVRGHCQDILFFYLFKATDNIVLMFIGVHIISFKLIFIVNKDDSEHNCLSFNHSVPDLVQKLPSGITALR